MSFEQEDKNALNFIEEASPRFDHLAYIILARGKLRKLASLVEKEKAFFEKIYAEALGETNSPDTRPLSRPYVRPPLLRDSPGTSTRTAEKILHWRISSHKGFQPVQIDAPIRKGAESVKTDSESAEWRHDFLRHLPLVGYNF